MGFLDFFSGGPPEKYEQKADAFVISGAYGHAKTEYEKALDKLDRLPDVKPGYRHLMEDKLRRCKESLAREHRQHGKALVEAGCNEEARELFDLALELTADPRLVTDIKKLIDNIPGDDEPEDYAFPGDDMPDTGTDEEDDPGSEEEYFTALCNSLEDVERDEYIRIVKDTLKFILIPPFTKA